MRFIGTRPDGTLFPAHDSGHGGWGACATHDGAGPFRTMAHGDTRIIPIELQETVLPFRIEEFALREDPPAPERFAAASAFASAIASSGRCMLQTNLDRTKFPPLGVHGGAPATPGRFTLIDAVTSERRSIDKENGLALKLGDLVCVETGGGGGYGPPSRRALAAIQRDLDAGYMSAAAAERDYAVRVGADGRARWSDPE